MITTWSGREVRVLARYWHHIQTDAFEREQPSDTALYKEYLVVFDEKKRQPWLVPASTVLTARGNNIPQPVVDEHA